MSNCKIYDLRKQALGLHEEPSQPIRNKHSELNKDLNQIEKQNKIN